MFEALKKITTAPSVMMYYNVGMLLDVPTATWVKGANGETIMVGGVGEVNSVIGGGNSFKTELDNFLNMKVLNNYKSSSAIIYDTENTLTYRRLHKTAHRMDNLKGINFELEQGKEEPRLLLCRGADISGDSFFEIIKGVSDERSKMKGQKLRTVPWLDAFGNHMVCKPPMTAAMDSLSMFQVASVNSKIYDSGKMGESSLNMGFMKDGAAKTQMFVQMPNVAAKGEMMFNMVAHVGNHVQMDPYAAQPAGLAFQANGKKTKGVPEKFLFINNNVFDIQGTSPLIKRPERSAEYPLVDADREKTNDLMKLRMVNTRNKSGPSGITFELIVSQGLGFQESLTEFHLCKENGRFGLEGNNTTYAMILYPECKIGRTTIRRKIDEDAKLRNAIKLTSQLYQLRQYHREFDEIWCEPETLYNDLVAAGYDWDELLQTRSVWKFKEDVTVEDGHYLSIVDLLNMRAGTYTPYWKQEAWIKANEKKGKKK